MALNFTRKYKWKEGDKLKVLKGYGFYDERHIKVGEIVTASSDVNTDNGNYFVVICTKEGKVIRGCYADGFEKVEDSVYDFKVGDRVRANRENSSSIKTGTIATIIRFGNKQSNRDTMYVTSEVQKETWVYQDCWDKIVSKETEGGGTMGTKKAYDVLVIDRKANKVLVQEVVIANNEYSAILQVGMNHTGKLKGANLDNLHFKINLVVEYTEVEDKRVIIEPPKKSQ